MNKFEVKRCSFQVLPLSFSATLAQAVTCTRDASHRHVRYMLAQLICMCELFGNSFM